MTQDGGGAAPGYGKALDDFRLDTHLLLLSRKAKDSGDVRDAQALMLAAEKLRTRPVLGLEYSQAEADAVAWMLGVFREEKTCTPGAIYSAEVSPTEVRLTVRLPDSLRLSDEAIRTHSSVIEGYVQRAILTMLIQSGHKGLPLPVPLIPRHPRDEEARRMISDAARVILDHPKQPVVADDAEDGG